MGSAGALLSHPPPQLGSILLRRHHISLPHLSSCMPEPLHCRRRHLRCSAVEGSSSQDTKLPASQREESPSSSLGATLQDPLPGRAQMYLVQSKMVLLKVSHRKKIRVVYIIFFIQAKSYFQMIRK
ncbi:hypothetical protein ACQJBY_026915 [Aegilops geniculata]